MAATEPTRESKTEQRAASGLGLRIGALLLLIATFAGVFASIYRAPQPVPLGRAQTMPTAILRRDGAWYWLEQSKGHSRLMRAAGSSIRPLAEAEALPRYAVEGGKLAWSARQGGQWSLQIAAADGSGQRTVWSGPDEPMGLALAAGRLAWLHRVPSPLTGRVPFPALYGTLDLLSAPQEGGPVTTVARLWETEEGQVLGEHSGALYVAAYRRGRPGSCRIYRIVPGNAPVRLVGTTGHPGALLTHDGALSWLAPSQESANSFTLWRLKVDGDSKPEPLSDWLPAAEPLYETTRGVVCGGLQDGLPALWPAGRPTVFPQALNVPDAYVALAAGENELLLARRDLSHSAPTLYRMQLP